MKPAVRVAITGAAGNIGYAMLFRIASGGLLGPDQPVILHLIEVEPALPALGGVVMELQDCAFPLLQGVVATSDLAQGFEDVKYAFLVGSRPRSKGMERNDLLSANGAIFKPQGEAINRYAASDVRVLVVGNPANTNALIALSNAPDIHPSQFSSMMRLDHNRAVSLLAIKAGVAVTDVKQVIVWGNHSVMQFPDISHTLISGRPATEVIDDHWYKNEYIPKIQKRGAEIIQARGASSAASAASAAIDHMATLIHGTSETNWVSMGICSDGSYGVAEGLVFSFPVHCHDSQYTIASDLSINPFAEEMIRQSEQELIEERDAVKDLLL